MIYKHNEGIGGENKNLAMLEYIISSSARQPLKFVIEMLKVALYLVSGPDWLGFNRDANG